MVGTPLWAAAILWTARRVAERKIRALLAEGMSLPLGERTEGVIYSRHFKSWGSTARGTQ